MEHRYTYEVHGKERIQFGENVMIQHDCWLDIAYDHPHPGPMMILGDGCNIGRRSTITAANLVEIGKWVLVGMNVHITDTDHEYHDPLIPVMFQELLSTNAETHIGDGTWVGSNSMIRMARVGKNCVIGFGSLVNKDIPDYCVAVGNPARVIKTYDFNKEQWVNV